MKVGDLVKIAPHCKNKGQLAIVVRVETWERNGVWIKYFDNIPGFHPESRKGGSFAIRKNLEMVNES